MMGTVMTDVSAETTDVLQQLIRNKCVNEGTPESGHEVRSVDLLESYLRAPGVEMKRYEPVPGRASLVMRLEGSDPKAPSLHYMGHTDVVPVTPSGWRHDPFAAELIDGEVWGRGAVDMLDVTAAMAVAVRRLMDSGFRPKGTLIFSAVADEEALGTYGAQWLTANAWDDVRADYLVTEFGGMRIPLGDGAPKLPLIAAEKGSQWTRLRVRGTPGHGSMPYHADNALLKAAEIDTDIRTIAGDDGPEVHEMLKDAIGDELWKDVEVVAEGDNPASESPTGTPLWNTLTKVSQKLVPGAETVPFLIVGATDARFFRRKGVTAYGYGLMSERISFKDFAKMFHGNNERIDQESLRLSTELFEQTARAFVG